MQVTMLVFWDLPSKDWFNINFNGSMQGTEAEAKFVVQSDTDVLVGRMYPYCLKIKTRSGN